MEEQTNKNKLNEENEKTSRESNYDPWATEKPTIQAINELNKYPIAASLLCYSVIERILKKHIIYNRGDKAKIDHGFIKYRGKSDQLKLLDYVDDKSNTKFMENFIVKISLGDAEKILGIKSSLYSTERNSVVHSNFLFEDGHLYKDREERSVIHEEMYDRAKCLLIEVLEKFSPQELSDYAKSILPLK